MLLVETADRCLAARDQPGDLAFEVALKVAEQRRQFFLFALIEAEANREALHEMTFPLAVSAG